MERIDPDTQARRIAAKLDDLARLRPALGDDGAPLAVDQRLDDDQLAALEARLGVALPASYRALARHVGTCGAGPDYGLAGVEAPMPSEMPQVTATVTGADGEVLAEAGSGPRPALPGAPSAARSFPLDAPWAPYDADGEAVPLPLPDGAHLYDGSLYLADIGCGYFYFLVVSGPHAGEVWCDQSAADGGGIGPLAPLLDWYERWVDDWLINTLASALVAAMPPGEPGPHAAALARWGHVLEERAAVDGAPGKALGELAMLRLYQGRADDVDALLARLETLPADQADRLPPGMVESITRWRHAAAVDAATATPPVGELAIDHPAWRIRRLLAENPTTPPALLARLAGDRELAIRLAAAVHPATDAAVLAALLDGAAVAWATTPDQRDALFAMDLVARHPATSDAVRARLATWDVAWPACRTAPWVVRAVAMCPATPPALRATLATHPHPCVREGVARAAATEPALLARLASDPDVAVRTSVARHAATPLATLRALVDDPDHAVCYALAERPGLDPTVQRALATVLDASVPLVLGGRRDLDEQARALLALRPDGVVRPPAGAAPAPPAPAPPPPPIDLELMGSGESGRPPFADPLLARRPRAALATLVTGRALANPGYPAPLLAAYVTDPDDMVPYAIAGHPWPDDATLRGLATARYAYTRAMVAARADLPADARDALFDDPSDIVHAPLAERADLPAAVLARWAASPVARTRQAAAAAVTATPALLTELAGDADTWVRAAVARHPATPDDVVTRLATDADAAVRGALLHRDAVPAALVDRLTADGDATVAAWARWRAARDAATAAPA